MFRRQYLVQRMLMQFQFTICSEQITHTNVLSVREEKSLIFDLAWLQLLLFSGVQSRWTLPLHLVSTSQDFRQVYSFNFTVSSFRLDRTYSTCKFKSLRIEMDSISTMKDNFRNDKVESLKFLFSNLARTKCIRTYSLYVIFEILIKQR